MTQIVDHNVGGVQYPVVADPWLGRALYYQPSVKRVSRGYIVSVVPTQFGGTMSTPVNLYMWWAHADEVKNKLGSNRGLWNAKIQEQLYCHIAGYPVSARPSYDMESWYPFMYWEALAVYKCNP
ncbi:DUF2599 domain-containing protein [Microbacterium sp. E-13]|uniref:DUF2599 domain-containing protein n=1 Tax=Microbacterium sp. E-13 TaxID=3404048 RepID=UPI003CF8071B